MPLDEQSQALLDARVIANIPPVWKQTVAQVRESRDQWRAKNAGLAKVEVHEVAEYNVPVDGGTIPVRVYRPSEARDLPAVVYFHGGGWVIGDLDHSDEVCRWITRQGGVVVVNVDYRLAPEHRFPVAAQDSYAATAWVRDNADLLGVAPGSIAVAGSSAGGNLAAAVALLARDAGAPSLAAQVLVYPVLDDACDSPSYVEFAEGFIVDAEDMRWYWRQYLNGPDDATDPRACPMAAPDLTGLPPTLVITAECDPVRDDGERYAQRLRQAGVATTASRYPGTLHGFFATPVNNVKGRAAVGEAIEFLRARFGLGEA
jgi:acetyl esterase